VREDENNEEVDDVNEEFEDRDRDEEDQENQERNQKNDDEEDEVPVKLFGKGNFKDTIQVRAVHNKNRRSIDVENPERQTD